MNPKFKVPKLKAEKQVKVGATTAGAPAQAETTVVERKKRVLSPEQKAKAIANLAKAREAKKAKGMVKADPGEVRDALHALDLSKATEKAEKQKKKNAKTHTPEFFAEEEKKREARQDKLEKKEAKAKMAKEPKAKIGKEYAQSLTNAHKFNEIKDSMKKLLFTHGVYQEEEDHETRLMHEEDKHSHSVKKELKEHFKSVSTSLNSINKLLNKIKC